MTQVNAGDILDARELRTIHGKPVRVPDPELLVHLQFRRYAGCPVCNLHLRSIAQRHDDILAAGIREVAVFHSKAETMLELQGQLPFAAVADPEKRLYAEFGVQKLSPLAALNPRSWLIAGRALTSAPSLRGVMGRGEKKMGLPAEFLIGTDGRVLAARYGKHLDDHWQVDDLLTLARLGVPSAGGG
ncbi:MAG TPA: peroxiredoxin-like family protein [Streptosporangiaceae bacterium]|jgi:peroxiredoxin|nr:peroxiredoxin-like family protein [Streptosporangiaceae bacterium]